MAVGWSRGGELGKGIAERWARMELMTVSTGLESLLLDRSTVRLSPRPCREKGIYSEFYWPSLHFLTHASIVCMSITHAEGTRTKTDLGA